MAATSLQNKKTFGRIGQSFRAQIVTVFSIILGLLLIIAGISYFSQARSAGLIDSLINVDGQISQLDLETLRLLSQARGSELGYQSNYTDLGFEESRTEYFVPWEEQVAQLRANLVAVDTLRLQRSAENESNLDDVLAQLDLYTVRFTELVSLYELRGFRDEGLEGELRAVIHNFEDVVTASNELQLQVDMLMLRRHEKDFILRGTTQYVIESRDRIALMKQHIEESTLDDATKQSLTDFADGYQVAFNRFVDTSFKIDRINREMTLAITTAQSLLEEKTEASQQTQEVAQANLTQNNQLSLLTILAATGVAFLLGISLIYGIVNRFTRQTRSLLDVVEQIEEGNLDARAEVVSQDELGITASALNQMLDTTTGLVQSEAERDAIQNSVMTLLEEVSLVAEGNLSIEAEVRDDLTGSIADSFNFMIEQLREIIGNVQEATSEVSSSAIQIQTTAEHLSVGSESQASQIVDTTAAIDEMSLSIQQVSENAALSASVGQESQANAQIGAKAVADTIEGMGRIREQVETTAERLERLSASSREIGKITKVINDISERTSILAINASIQASEAGDAGRGFAVVAEEVERLADRSVMASGQINKLVRAIQEETVEVIRAMESTSDEVARGNQLAHEAGDRLNEIGSVSTRLNELLGSISQAAKQQARGSEAIARSMNEIADVTQQTAAGTKQATTSIGKLAILADELSASVSQFKIDDGPNESDSAELLEETF